MEYTVIMHMYLHIIYSGLQNENEGRDLHSLLAVFKRERCSIS